MNEQVEALIERTRLTEEEHFYLHFATPYKCKSKEMDAYLRGLNDGCEAQQKKIFNDPDLALIVGKEEIVCNMCGNVAAEEDITIPLALELKEAHNE